MPLHVVYNPACGDKTAKAFFQDHVLPFLKGNDKQYASLIETSHEGHAGEVVSRLLSSSLSGEETLDIVLGSGDGTLHEIVNGYFGLAKSQSDEAKRKVRVVLVPCGTANALYASLYPPPPAPSDEAQKKEQNLEYRLKSLKEYVGGKARDVPLSFGVTRLVDLKEQERELVSSVVISTSLHAAILRDSEALRDEYPGIERFKVAAQKNSDKWYQASVELFPLEDGTKPQIYDPQSQSFKAIDSSSLRGPFAYFLSTVNVDRLEPAFVVSPLARRIPPPPGTCDIVIVRPLRDPSLDVNGEEERKKFVDKLWGVMGGAYQDGKHVGLRYGPSGEVVGEVGEGEYVVEYVRCGGWKWVPEEDGARWVCSDGLVVELGRGESAECRVSSQGSGLTVCASR